MGGAGLNECFGDGGADAFAAACDEDGFSGAGVGGFSGVDGWVGFFVVGAGEAGEGGHVERGGGLKRSGKIGCIRGKGNAAIDRLIAICR